MAEEQGEVNGGGGAARGPRSPNFPAITLQDALTKARVLYDKDRRASVSAKTVLAHLGFSEKLSGSSARVLSALKQFGLMDENAGQYRVTDAAFRLFTLSESSPERQKALQDCARKPTIYREVLDKYEDGLPSDAALSDYLLLNKKFNPVSVPSFIRVFKATLEFAKLTPGAYTGVTEREKPSIAVGDFVQWESQGVLQFEAKKVVAVTPDRTHLYVEGSQTGIPMEQVSKVDPPAQLVMGAHIPSGAQTFPGSITNTGGISVKSGSSIAREVWAIDEGEAMLVFPSSISAQSVEDIEGWLKLVVAKLKRRSGATPKAAVDPDTKN
jgi:hypothetical protein